jgi:hypothetical protein
LTGCTSNDPPTPGGSSSGAAHPRTAAPKDRDETAVLAALRRLDLCAVLRSAATTAPAAQPRARDPFSCGMAGSPGASVSISQIGTDERLKLPVRAIGDAKAYVDYATRDTCLAYFPVSFELALKFDVDRVKGDCGPAINGFLAAAATTLTGSAALTATPQWDACGALAEALGDDADPRALTWAGTGVGAACERWEPSVAHLEFGYRNPLIGATRTETVGGVQVRVQEDDSTGRTVCWTAWQAGPAGSPELWAGVAAEDCGKAATLAKSVMTVLESPPPDVAPQRPLLYGADEADSPYLGACGNLERQIARHCQPFVEMSVPNGRTAILRAAETDVDVHCAVALDAIRKHFGAQLVPVTVDDGEVSSCYFVEPERQVRIQFRIGADPVHGVADVFTVRDAEFAGHPGYVENSPDRQAYRVWVGVSGDPADDGLLSLTVDGGPASRGAGPPADTAAKVERVITGILARYFS